MRICLLTYQDIESDDLLEYDWPCDPRPFVPEAEWHVAVLTKATAVRCVRALAREGFDLFFNLCDAAPEEDAPGIEVVRALERLGVPFTGATSGYFDPSRVATKRAARKVGVATPAYVMARTAADVERAAARLRFPLIVKHHASYASIDLSRASRVVSPAGLRRQARKIIARHGKALIEEFVEGRECTVLVAENPRDARRPTTYTPIEYEFPAGESFKHSALKWETYAQMKGAPLADAKLSRQLRSASARVFVALRGAGYGRLDFRVDRDGVPYLLEINPNCGIFYPPDAPGSADLCLLHSPGGHEAFTRQVVAAALKRARRGVTPRRAGR